MPIKLLPDSSITSMAMGNDVYAYAQTYDGDIYQFVGNVENSTAFYGSRRKSNVIIERLRGNNPRPGAPKLFTPIAAVSFTERLNQPMNERFVFYLDDNNILHDQHDTGNGDYQEGSLASRNIRVGSYSRLAATVIKGDVVNHICLFYQAPTPDAAIKMVSYAGLHRSWTDGPANLRDPPLYGTSITAVPPRPGILGRTSSDKSNDRQPIYYLQMDNNALGSGQGASEPLPLSGYDRDGLPLAFSPHTSLTAIDNGAHLHLIYKSNSGQVKVIRIDSTQGPQMPELFFKDVEVAPRSAIAACLGPSTTGTTSIVLFYQVLDQVTRKVQMAARVVYRATSVSSADAKWGVSEKEILGE